jgi:hypothetical protein
MFARNMLSWSWRSIKQLLLHLVGVPYYFTYSIYCIVLCNKHYVRQSSYIISWVFRFSGRSQCLRGLRCGSVAACLLGLRVRMPLGAWMSLSFECCLLSSRALCVGLITRPESYRVWRVCDREALIKRRPWPSRGCDAIKNIRVFPVSIVASVLHVHAALSKTNGRSR